MTQEELTQLAKEAGGGNCWWPMYTDTLERFANLVIAAKLQSLLQSEREGWRYADELEQERKRLHEENAALLKALRVAVLALAHANEAAPGLYDDAYNKVSDAIDQAEGR